MTYKNTPRKPPEDCTPAHERDKLPAERDFDKYVYGGISYAAQALAGIGLSYWIKYGSGKPIYNKIANWMGENFISKITTKRGADAIKEADHWIVVSTMVMMGNAFILPVKWLENKKAEIVRAWTEKDNQKRAEQGNAPSSEDRQKQQELLQQLEDAPKQSWWSLGFGRAFALAGVYATVHGVGQRRNEAMENAFSGAVTKTMGAVGMKSASKSQSVKGLFKITFNDLFYSTISAGGLYVYSHFIHPQHKCEDEPATQPLAAPSAETPHTTIENPAITKNAQVVGNTIKPFAEKRHSHKHESFTDYAKPDAASPTLMGV